MATEPIIYTKNYVSADDVFVSSHGDSFLSRLYDRDKRSYWISSGANSDLTEMTLEITFYEGVNAIDRAIDRCIIINHNLKSPTIEYWDGNSWETFASGSNLTTSNNIFTSTERTTAKVRVRCSTTQVADAEKFIGEIVFCKVQSDIGSDLVAYDPTTRREVKEMRLADGQLHQAFVKHSQYRSEKYEMRGRFKYLTLATLETLRRIKDSGQAFLWHPESISQVDELYLVNWVGPLRWQYASDYKSAGVTLDIDFKEV